MTIPYHYHVMGTMFGGKTEEVLEQASVLEDIAQRKVQIFVAVRNIARDGEGRIMSHKGREHKAVNIHNAENILPQIEKDTYAVVIDEVHFFPKKEIFDVVSKLLQMGVRVYTGGLVSDFQGEPFEATLNLIVHADELVVKRAICTHNNGEICGRKALYNQRFINEVVATTGEKLVVGADEAYQPRCREHFIWPSNGKKAVDSAEQIIRSNKDEVQQKPSKQTADYVM